MKVRTERLSNLVTFEPTNKKERRWMADNVQAEGWQWLGRALAVDARVANDLADGMSAAGFALRAA
jgi:hypothetical protein